MADTTINISEIITAFGAYFLGDPEKKDLLFKRPFAKFGTREALHLLPTNATRKELGIVEQQEIIQAYQDDFTPKGGVVFKPKTIDLVPVKIDQEFNPSKLVDSWLGFLTNNNVKRSEWPFIRWFIEAYLLNQADDDLERSVIYKGARVEPTAGTAGATVASMTGIRKRINDGITANDIEPILTGAPNADPVTWCEQVEAFIRAIDEDYWDLPMTLNMNKTLAQRYRDGRKEKYNMNYAQVSDLNKVNDFDNITVAGRTSMKGSNKIWSAAPGNFVLLVKGFSNKDAFLLEHSKRKVAIYTDWWMGTDYILGNQIFTNDQDLA